MHSSVADPENQWGDGGLPKGATAMVKKQFSKHIWLSKTFFSHFLWEKIGKTNREGAAVAGPPNSWILHWHSYNKLGSPSLDIFN
jgi:hypothetical protein